MVTLSASPQSVSELETCGTVYWLNPRRVRPFPNQVRKRFRGIAKLARGIQEIGQTTPIVVRLIEDDADFDAELVDGERRLRACCLIPNKKIRAVTDSDVKDEKDQFAHCVAANFGKQGHDAMEILEAILRFVDEGRTHQQIADIFGGMSTAWVSQYLSLRRLDPSVQQLLIPDDEDVDEEVDVDDKKPSKNKRKAPLPFSIALLLVPLEQEHQRQAAEKIIKDKMTMAAARRHVLNLRRTGGGDSHTSNTYPREIWQSLERLTKNFREKFGVFLDMSQSELDRIVLSAGPTNQRIVVAELRDLVSEIEQVASAVQRVSSK